MPKINSSVFFAALIALAINSAPAHAQQARTFVSGAIGNDANAPNCLRNAPCRTFQVAHDNTLPFGEITVLDPGSYGAVLINRSISIINDGVGEAGMLISGGNTGVTINAGATDKVTLRGLTIKGIGFGGGNGIVLTQGASLSIENCVVRNITGSTGFGYGIVLAPNLAGGASSLDVSDTVVTDNSFIGIGIIPRGTGSVHAVINRVASNHNGAAGIVVDDSAFSGSIFAAVESSVAAGNANAGFEAVAPAQHGPIFMTVIRSVSEGNGNGFLAGASAVLDVGRSTVIGNTHTWPSLTIESYKDNYVHENLDGDPPANLSVTTK